MDHRDRSPAIAPYGICLLACGLLLQSAAAAGGEVRVSGDSA